MKAMLTDIEKRMPGRKDTMIRAMGNIRPSHMLDLKLFDFAGWHQRLSDGAEAPDAEQLAFFGDQHTAESRQPRQSKAQAIIGKTVPSNA